MKYILTACCFASTLLEYSMAKWCDTPHWSGLGTRGLELTISNNWNKIIYVIVAHSVVFFVYESLHEALTENPCVPERGRKDTHYKQTTVGWHCYLRSMEAILLIKNYQKNTSFKRGKQTIFVCLSVLLIFASEKHLEYRIIDKHWSSRQTSVELNRIILCHVFQTELARF